VLGGASHQEAWLAVRRAAQSLCSAWGGGGRPARTQRRAVHNEASQRRTVVGLGLLRAALRGGRGRRRLDGGSFSEWRRSRAAGGSSGGRSGAAVEVSEERNGAAASRQVAAATKQVTATRQLTMAAAAVAHMQPGAHGGRRGGGTAAWPRVASTVTRQPACLVKRLVPLTCGPSSLFEFPMIFNHVNFEIQNSDLPDVQHSPNFA
jgi:hypothetical protein